MPKAKPVVTLEIESAGRAVMAHVLLDGVPADGEVQFFVRTPYRQTSGGMASMEYRDPAEFALSAARRQPRSSFEISARVLVGESYIYSDTIEIEIN